MEKPESLQALEMTNLEAIRERDKNHKPGRRPSGKCKREAYFREHYLAKKEGRPMICNRKKKAKQTAEERRFKEKLRRCNAPLTLYERIRSGEHKPRKVISATAEYQRKMAEAVNTFMKLPARSVHSIGWSDLTRRRG